MPYNVSFDGESPYIVNVGGEHALTVTVEGHNVHYEWQGEWATWDDLHSSAQIKELQAKANELVARGSKGMKGGSAKGKHGVDKGGGRGRPGR